jgi:4-hydroxybenzoate polyprenyltransferase
MKRITHWPQLVLGVAFNSGIVIAALSLQSHDILNWKALSCLYAAGILWTIAYDTIYAFQDIQDDLKIGVRSTAIISRTHPHLFIGLFYGISLLLLGLCGYFSGLDIWFYISLLSVAGAMAKILRQFSPTDPKACLTCFKSNQWIGWLIFLSLVKV